MIREGQSQKGSNPESEALWAMRYFSIDRSPDPLITRFMSLLRHRPRRENLWDGGVAAILVEWVMGV